MLQGAVWSMLAPSRGVPRLGTSTSSASQTRYGPAFRRASAIPFYVAAPPDQSGRARGYPTQSTTLYIILIFANATTQGVNLVMDLVGFRVLLHRKNYKLGEFWDGIETQHSESELDLASENM